MRTLIIAAFACLGLASCVHVERSAPPSTVVVAPEPTPAPPATVPPPRPAYCPNGAVSC